MKSCPRLLIILSGVALAILPQVSVLAQVGPPPAGVIAFVGVDDQNNASIYVMDLASGRIGQVGLPVMPDADLEWHPDGDVLAFTSQDGGYGVLRSLRGCFDAGICADSVEVLPPFFVQQLAWSPDGAMLYFQTDTGMKVSPPRARQATDLTQNCGYGFALSSGPVYLFCAAENAAGNIETGVFEAAESGFAAAHDIGTFPAITAFDIGSDGQSAVGTLESAGDSGFFSPVDGAPVRFANYQVHVYDLEFRPDGASLAIIGATSDSTGDGTLRDGDPAELFLYDPATGQLTQIPGFTDAASVTWAPDGTQLLVATTTGRFLVYRPEFSAMTPVNAVLPQPGLRVSALDWNPSLAILPIVPTATFAFTSTPIPTPTPAATLTPLPTLTPFPSLTPFPTFTPIPTVTPGSPLGTGCQYAYAGGGVPVAIGDTAEVTQHGAAVRFRTQPALTATMLRELLSGTRMTILSGPYCAQGYRWWEARLTDGRVGFLADSDPTGYWIQRVAPAPPSESISFYADRYTINTGECATVRWDVEGIREVYFEGIGVTGHDSRVVCPATTTTYTLRIVRLDSSENYQQVTILVTSPY